VDLVNPLKKNLSERRQKTLFSEKKIGCGKYFMYGAGEFICGGALHVNGRKNYALIVKSSPYQNQKSQHIKNFRKLLINQN